MSHSHDNLARCLPSQTEPQPESPAEPRSLRLRDVMREHIVYVLTRTDWVIEGSNGAAALLDMKPSTLRYRIRILGIRKPSKPDPTDHVAQLFRQSRPRFRT